MRLVVTDIEDGKYDRANLSFDDGTRLSCNTTGMRALARAYGTESSTSLPIQVSLSVP